MINKKPDMSSNVNGKGNIWLFREKLLSHRSGLAFIIFVYFSIAFPGAARTAGIDAKNLSDISGDELEDIIVRAENSAQSGDLKSATDILNGISLRGHPPKWFAENVDILDAIGTLYLRLGERQRGLEFWSIPAAVLEQSAPNSNVRAETLHGLGAAFKELGEFELAEANLMRSLSIYEQRQDKPWSAIATVHNDLGHLYQTFGLFAQSENEHKTALSIRRNLDANSNNTAISLNNLACTLRRIGDYSKAQNVYLEAEKIAKNSKDIDQKLIAALNNNIAVTKALQGDLIGAEFRHREALKVRKSIFIPNHPEIVTSKNNLASLLIKFGRFDEAKSLLLDDLEFNRKHLPSYLLINTLDKVADLYAATENYNGAISAQSEALQMGEQLYGSIHPEVIDARSKLAALLVRMSRSDSHTNPAQGSPLIERATALMFESLANSEQLLHVISAFVSESGMDKFLRSRYESADLVYSLAADDLENPQLLRVAFATALLWKGRSTDEAADKSSTILRSLPPSGRSIFEKLTALRRELGMLILGDNTIVQNKDRKVVIERKLAAIESYERQLAAISSKLRTKSRIQPAQIIDEVTRRLPPDSALVEIVEYHPSRLKYNAQLGKKPMTHYLALVLRPDGTVRAAALGERDGIDQEIVRILDQVAHPPTGGCASNSIDLRTVRSLYQRTLSKLRPWILDRQHLLMSLDGSMHFLPFAVLHDEHGPLVERIRFTYLTSGRDLLRHKEKPASNSVVVFADPATGDSQGPASNPKSSPLPLLAQRSQIQFDLDNLPALKNVTREIEAIKAFFPGSEIYTKEKATVASFTLLRAPGILHAAVHGIYFTGLAESINPLFSTGLVLSDSDSSLVPMDGIPRPLYSRRVLTAYDVASMDLWGTQLVVLSACDTGLGYAARGQGVYGFRRSFMIAGADTLLGSLWKINDAATASFMVSFYKNLSKGLSKGEAFHEAVMEVRSRHPHPYYWAPFILIGDTSRLNGYSTTGQLEDKSPRSYLPLLVSGFLLLLGICFGSSPRLRRRVSGSRDLHC